MAYDDNRIANMMASLRVGGAAPEPTAKPKAESKTQSDKKDETPRKPKAAKPASKPKEPAERAATDTSLDEVLRKAGEGRERRTRPISIAIKPSEYEAWKAAADSVGISLSAFVTIVVNDFVSRGGGVS